MRNKKISLGLFANIWNNAYLPAVVFCQGYPLGGAEGTLNFHIKTCILVFASTYFEQIDKNCADIQNVRNSMF